MFIFHSYGHFYSVSARITGSFKDAVIHSQVNNRRSRTTPGAEKALEGQRRGKGLSGLKQSADSVESQQWPFRIRGGNRQDLARKHLSL